MFLTSEPILDTLSIADLNSSEEDSSSIRFPAAITAPVNAVITSSTLPFINFISSSPILS